MIQELVSVVIPSYNRAGSLPRAVASCMEQSYPHVEVIVVDDGSCDDTPTVLLELEGKYGKERFRWARQENAGACVARNLGMDMARGEFLQFLDSDDYLDTVKFEKQIEALRASDADVAVCDMQVADGYSPEAVLARNLNDEDIHRKVASFGTTYVFAPLIRRDRIPGELRWNPLVPRCQDNDFMFKLFLSIQNYVYTPGFWCTWIHHGGERISDGIHVVKVPYLDVVEGAYRYWAKARKAIPRANDWMVPSLCHRFLSEDIVYSRDRTTLVRGFLLAFRRPWSSKVAFFALRCGVKAMVPGWLLDSLRARPKDRA